MSITDERITELCELCEKATAGPWKLFTYRPEGQEPTVTPSGRKVLLEGIGLKSCGSKPAEMVCSVGVVDIETGGFVTDEDVLFRNSPNNSAFITSAREALPACLDEIAKLRERLALATGFNVNGCIITGRDSTYGIHRNAGRVLRVTHEYLGTDGKWYAEEEMFATDAEMFHFGTLDAAFAALDAWKEQQP